MQYKIKDPTCFKSSNLSCIDNFCTNKKTFLIHLLPRLAFLTTIVWIVQSVKVRSTFCKDPAKFIYHRSYNNYNKEQFKNVLKQRLVSSSNFGEFFDTFLATLNEHAPLKKNTNRYNHHVCMNKTLRKAIMKRSKLRNTFNQNRSSENWQYYKRQRNIC